MRLITIPVHHKTWPNGPGAKCEVIQQSVLVNPDHIIAIYPPYTPSQNDKTWISMVGDGNPEENGVSTCLDSIAIMERIRKAQQMEDHRI